MLRALSLLEPPDSGTIRVDSASYDFPLEEEQQIIPPWPKVTVVFQQLFLWPHLTLQQNLRLPLRGLDAAVVTPRINHLVQKFNLLSCIDRFPNQTSLGQRQRAALVRALVLQPSYLLLDEITSALDLESISVVLGHLEELRNEGVGILIVTHLTGFARRAADRIIFLESGCVLESGGREVLENPSHERVKRFLSVMGEN